MKSGGTGYPHGNKAESPQAADLIISLLLLIKPNLIQIRSVL